MHLVAPRLASLLLLVALLGAAGVAVAQSARGQQGGAQDRGARNDDTPPQPRDRREDHRALSDAVRRVERATGGEVLSAERVPFDGRDVSRVKVVDASGRVRVYMDDPPTRSRNDNRRENSPTRRDDGDND